MIPYDEYEREEYGAPRHMEEFLGTDREGKPLPKTIPKDYRYTGPDVRD